MKVFLTIFSDKVWLPLLLIALLFIFLKFLGLDILSKLRGGGTGAQIKRGRKSWGSLLSFWAISVVLVSIIVSSDLIANHRVIIGLLSFSMLVYLNIFSVNFKGKIIKLTNKIENLAQQV